jgi:hypothetical protein
MNPMTPIAIPKAAVATASSGPTVLEALSATTAAGESLVIMECTTNTPDSPIAHTQPPNRDTAAQKHKSLCMSAIYETSL